MKMNINSVVSCGLVLALTGAVGYGVANAGEKKDMTSKTAASSVVTNDNGSVSRTFVESSITTNGNLVTEHRDDHQRVRAVVQRWRHGLEAACEGRREGRASRRHGLLHGPEVRRRP